MDQRQWQLKTKLGSLFLVASEEGLLVVSREEQSVPFAISLQSDEPAVRVLKLAATQLTEYAEGQRTDFDLPLVIEGTPFQKKVWEALCQIPYGETVSYREIAMRIHNEKAVRAVGSANGRNAHCIVIPCHRVIAADGSLGGYSGGLDFKTLLLDLEKKSNTYSHSAHQ